MYTRQQQKVGPCDACGTVRRIFEAEWIIEKQPDDQVVERRKWFCRSCYGKLVEEAVGGNRA